MGRVCTSINYIILDNSNKKGSFWLTCLLLIIDVVLDAVAVEVIFETSVFITPPELGSVEAAGAGETALVPSVMLGGAFEFIVEVAAIPAVPTAECAAEECAIRSESLSDKSELLEELSLMSQCPLDPVLAK